MIFVDTGPFLARYLANDEHHAEARAGFARLESERLPLATSSHVLDETITLLGRWAGHAFAAKRARSLLASRVLRVIRATADEELEAVSLFERYADQRVSFTDAVSFALMRRHGIRDAFTFDRHFALAGFSRWPDSA